MTHSIFAACAPGLEPLLVAEIDERLGIEATAVPGGAELEGDVELLARANLQLGLALKILVRVARFKVRSFAELEKRCGRIAWDAWIARAASVRPRVTCKKSRLYHSGAVAERLERFIGADGSGPDIDVHARIERDVCTISIDVSGEPLHKRGYRALTGAAPLREDLARALLVASGWDRRGAVADPFCGSATLLIEAHLLATGRAPGAARAFALEDMPCSDAAMWKRLRSGLQPGAPAPTLRGSDRDARAIAIARDCAGRAGVALELEVADAASAPLWGEGAALIASNPPYGRRVGGAGGALRILGERLPGHPGGVALVLPAATRPPRGLGLRPALTTDHGGQKIGFWVRP